MTKEEKIKKLEERISYCRFIMIGASENEYDRVEDLLNEAEEELKKLRNQVKKQK